MESVMEKRHLTGIDTVQTRHGTWKYTGNILKINLEIHLEKHKFRETLKIHRKGTWKYTAQCTVCTVRCPRIQDFGGVFFLIWTQSFL